MKKRKKRSNHPSYDLSVVSASLLGASVAFFLSLILGLFCSLIALFSEDPNRLIAPFSFAACFLVYFFCGFLAVKFKKSAIPCGLISGCMLSVILFIVSLFINDALSSNYTLTTSILIRLIWIFISLLGSLAGVNSRKKRK